MRERDAEGPADGVIARQMLAVVLVEKVFDAEAEFGVLKHTFIRLPACEKVVHHVAGGRQHGAGYFVLTRSHDATPAEIDVVFRYTPAEGQDKFVCRDRVEICIIHFVLAADCGVGGTGKNVSGFVRRLELDTGGLRLAHVEVGGYDVLTLNHILDIVLEDRRFRGESIVRKSDIAE